MTDRVGDMQKKELLEIVDDRTLTKEEMQEIVRETVSQTLTQLGVDTSSPLEMQRDFQHLRDWRMAQEVIRNKGYMALVTVLVTGTAGLLWLGFKNFFIDLVN